MLVLDKYNVPVFTDVFVNQGERQAVLLGVLVDEENQAYQALYEYEMPKGTTALYFDEVGTSPKFQKSKPGYNTMSLAWLELLVENDVHWVGRMQGWEPRWHNARVAKQPAEQLAARKG